MIFKVKVKALHLLTNEKVELVAENKEIIANIILNKLCKFVEINNNVAYYDSEFAFNVSEDIFTVEKAKSELLNILLKNK